MKMIYLNTLTPEEIIKRLKNGGVIKLGKTGALSIKMIDGVIVTKEKTTDNFTIGDKFYIDGREDYYFEEPEEFKVEKTGLYMTRDCRVAYVSFIKDIDNNSYPVVAVILGDVETTTWSIKGKRYDTKESGEDLVEYLGD